jgi:hypothetical protein
VLIIVADIVLLVSISPWSLLDICTNHPEGHEEKAHHGSCKDGMMDDHDKSKDADSHKVTFSNVSCTTFSPVTDDYQLSVPYKLPTPDQLILVAVILDIVSWRLPEKEFYPIPDYHNDSGPPLVVNALRGPPFV